MDTSEGALHHASEPGNNSFTNTRPDNSPQAADNDSSCNSPEQENEISDGREGYCPSSENQEDDIFTVVNMSPNTRLQRIRNRSRRAVRGELIARTIMENTNQQTEISRQQRENLQKEILLRMDESARKESELINIMKEDVLSSKEDRKQLLHCMSTIVDLLSKSRPPTSLNIDNCHADNSGAHSQTSEILVPETLPQLQGGPHSSKYTKIKEHVDYHNSRPTLFGLTMYNTSSDSETDDDLVPLHNNVDIEYASPEKNRSSTGKDQDDNQIPESSMSSVTHVDSVIQGNYSHREIEPQTQSQWLLTQSEECSQFANTRSRRCIKKRQRYSP